MKKEKFAKNHTFKESLQIDGWGKNVFIFNKLSFYKKWYLQHKSILDNPNFDPSILIEAIKAHIESRSPNSLFVTKFIDSSTEINLPFNLHTNKIENNFERLWYNRETNNSGKIPKKLKENLDYLGQYFSLQKTRTFQTITDLFVSYKKNNPFENNRNYALQYREYYNVQYIEIFSKFHSDYLKDRNNILFINGDNINPETFYYLPEINTMSFYDYLRFVPFKHDYQEEILKKSYFSILKNNKMIFYVVTPSKWSNWDRIKTMIQKRDFYAYFLDNPQLDSYYSPLAEHLAATWNSFAIQSCCEYCIVKNEDIDINYIKNNILIMHENGGMNKFYDEDCSNMLEIKQLDKLL